MSFKKYPNALDFNETGGTTTVRGRKRQSSSTVDNDITQSEDVMTMLDKFGAGINKALIAKRKCLESLTNSSVKTSHQKIEQLWRSQQRDRSNVTEDYSTQFNAVFHQWDIDVQRNKDQDEKLMSMFQHQQKMFQHMRAARGQRLKTLKQLLDQYIKSLQELDNVQIRQQSAVQSELQQEMALFHKKMLMNTQQKEMASVRKSLQSMLL